MSITTLLEIIQSNISIIIISIFGGIPLLIGYAAATKSVSTISDFFLCNSSLGTTTTFFTVYATWWSSFAFLGSTAAFYSEGIIYWIALGWNVLFSLLFLVLGTKIWRQKNQFNFKSPIDFFTKRYNSKGLNNLILSIMIILSIPYIEVQFMGGGILIEIATNGAIPWKLSTLLFFIIMIIYLWSGGLRAVAWTDTFYTILILFGMLFIGIIFIRMTGGISNTFQKIAEISPSSLKLPKTINGVTGYGFWLSLFIIMPLGEIMMPQIWTRTLAVKNEKTFYIMPFLLSVATVAYVGTMLAGNSAIILIPNHLGYSDYILPAMLTKYLSPPLVAFLLCCAAAACLSTVNSQLHSLSQLITLSIYKPYFNKKATEKHLILVAKLVILFSAILSYVILLYGSISSILFTVFNAFCGMTQIAVPVIGGLYWKKSTAKGSIIGILLGLIVLVALTLYQPIIYPVSPGLIGLIANIVSFVLIGHFSHEKNLISMEGNYEKK